MGEETGSQETKQEKIMQSMRWMLGRAPPRVSMFQFSRRPSERIFNCSTRDKSCESTPVPDFSDENCAQPTHKSELKTAMADECARIPNRRVVLVALFLVV